MMFTNEEKYCSFIKFGLHHYQPTQWLLTHSTHLPCTYVHMCTSFVSFAVFIYYFNCISFAIRLSGHKVAIKLAGWILRQGKGYSAEKAEFISWKVMETFSCGLTDAENWRNRYGFRRKYDSSSKRTACTSENIDALDSLF